jgi:hypothetical protein
MAYAFLKALGLNGDLGTFTVDLKTRKMTASKGHDATSPAEGEYRITSSRFPFCPCIPGGQGKSSYPVCATDNPEKDNSIRSGMTLVPFNPDLNRLILIAKNGEAKRYTITWGSESKSFTSEQLAQGVNLADEFPINPFGETFAKVDAAVAAKQAYETKQIKTSFRSKEAKADLEAVVAQTEKERAPLVAAIKAAFVPVTHTIKITAE